MLTARKTMKASTTWRISRSGHGLPLIEELASHLGVSRKQAKRLLDARSVFINRQRVWMARHEVRAGDVIEVTGAPPARRTAVTPAPSIRVLREHPDWLVVAKPAGLVSNGPGSVEEALRTQRREPQVEAVHRLDRDTTGCLLLARHPHAREILVRCFEENAVRKCYVALVQGEFPAGLQTIRQPLEGLSAETTFRVLASHPRASLVEARPLTGRTHQIRLHARAAGHPLVGDRVYATGVVEDAVLRQMPRQMLHAWKLGWPDPQGPVEVEAPWPDDFRNAMAKLGLRYRPVRVKPCGGT